jgi:hypothetical protein
MDVFLNGALRVVLWGACAFVILPIVVNLVWDAASDGLETASDGATFGFVAGFVLAFLAVAVFLLVHVADAAIRTYRGLADLRHTVTVDGQVVKHHSTEGMRWFAVDPGRVDEVKAYRPGDDGAYPPRGANVQMVLTPHLHHVVSVHVVEPDRPLGAAAR